MNRLISFILSCVFLFQFATAWSEEIFIPEKPWETGNVPILSEQAPPTTANTSPHSTMPPIPSSNSAQGSDYRANLPSTPLSPPPSKIRALGREEIEYIRNLVAGICSVRRLPYDPRNERLLGKLLETGHRGCRLLGLAHFPIMPRLYVRHDETVLRDRSFQAYEYRKFGAFQTKLDGWINPIGFYIHFDIIFRGRGQNYGHIMGNITKEGPLTGVISSKGSDAWGRIWKLRYSLKDLMINDNGRPSGGWLQLEGSDPAGRSQVLPLLFPLDDAFKSEKVEQRRVSNWPALGREYRKKK